jgi:hypothetical protein
LVKSKVRENDEVQLRFLFANDVFTSGLFFFPPAFVDLDPRSCAWRKKIKLHPRTPPARAMAMAAEGMVAWAQSSSASDHQALQQPLLSANPQHWCGWSSPLGQLRTAAIASLAHAHPAVRHATASGSSRSPLLAAAPRVRGVAAAPSPDPQSWQAALAITSG